MTSFLKSWRCSDLEKFTSMVDWLETCQNKMSLSVLRIVLLAERIYQYVDTTTQSFFIYKIDCNKCESQPETHLN